MSSSGISVVMATYNGDAFLEEQLQSIARQTLRPQELVVSDDGSTDATPELVNRFRKAAPFPVTLLRHKKLGVGDNFLRAVRASQGTLIAFADQDDVWHPSKLEVSAAALHKHDALLVIHGAMTVDGSGHAINTGYQNARHVQIRERLESNVWYHGWGNTMLFRRDVLSGGDWLDRPLSQWPGHRMNHDDLVATLAGVRGRKVRLPDPLIEYRQHGRNVAGAPQTLGQAFRAHREPVSAVEHRVRVATTWAEYFSAAVPATLCSETREYFLRAARVMERRGSRLRGPLLWALPSLTWRALRGDYSERSTAGFGWQALLQDLLWFASPARLRRHPTANHAGLRLVVPS